MGFSTFTLYKKTLTDLDSVDVSALKLRQHPGGRKNRKLEMRSILQIADGISWIDRGDRARHDSGKLAKIKNFWLVVGDATACFVSVVLAYLLVDFFKALLIPFYDRLTVQEAIGLAPLMFFLPFLGVLLLCQHKGHYTRFKGIWDELGEFWLMSLCMVGITVVCLYFTQYKFSRFWLLGSWLTILVLVPIARLIVKRKLKNHNLWFTPAVIVGTGPNALSAALAIESDDNFGFKVVSMIDASLPEPASSEDASHLEVRDELKKRNKHYPINKRVVDSLPTYVSQSRPYVVLALEAEDYVDNQDIVEEFLISRRNLSIFPPLKAIPLIGTEIDPIYRHEALHLRVQTKLANWRSRSLKRLLDVIVSLTGLIVLSPLFFLLYVKIRSDRGPAFYGQERVGRGGRIFRCWKFRSMLPNADELLARFFAENPSLIKEYNETQKLREDPRVTPFGQFIRKYSIDELPQLYNVLTGSMSIVGPRPVRPDELHTMYGASARYYLMSAPGITGLWQISGRNSLNYGTRVNLDSWYVRNWTLWGDLKIILSTITVVIAAQGAY